MKGPRTLEPSRTDVGPGEGDRNERHAAVDRVPHRTVSKPSWWRYSCQANGRRVVARDLKRRDPAERKQALTNYDAFMTWIERVPREGSRQYRHTLRYFAFPDATAPSC